MTPNEEEFLLTVAAIVPLELLPSKAHNIRGLDYLQHLIMSVNSLCVEGYYIEQNIRLDEKIWSWISRSTCWRPPGFGTIGN